MTNFRINGVERNAPVGSDQNFDALIGFVHTNMVNDTSLIASVRVNGVEISENEEKALATIPLAELESVEINFIHPRELAEETLQTLRTYTDSLADLSKRIAREYGSAEANQDYTRLIEGIQTMADTVIHVRKVLRIGILPIVNVLEVDLLSILKDLVETHGAKDPTYRIQLLEDHLPTNLTQWRDTGIPEMIRCRDS